MSRDWCPLETYIAREQLLQEQGVDLFEIGKQITIVVDEKSTPLFQKEELAFFDDYKWLGTIGRDVLSKVYWEYHDTLQWDNILNTLDAVENQLSEIISHIIIGSNNGEINRNDIMDHHEVVSQWFLGELDKNFYYAEQNNELFFNYILEESNVERKENNYESHLE